MADYDWAVYFENDLIESEASCCVADDVTVDDDEEEIICNVLANCFGQKPNCEASELADAINYYSNNDDYMDL